jgi:hypothetical protein
MTTVSFKKAAILSYIAKRKDLSPLQRRALRAAMSGKVLNFGGGPKSSSYAATVFRSKKRAITSSTSGKHSEKTSANS